MFRSLPHIECISLRQFPDYILPEETGHTFMENAVLKAVQAAAHFQMWVLADDSGLVVPALKGDPGVYSARYAGLNATDADNRKKLLENMQGLEGDARTAFYECCLALANPKGLQKTVEGICDGHITTEPRGRHGFGYDPLFIKNDYDKTFAELDDSVKNRVSHRRKAFERLLAYLESIRD